MLTSQTPRVIQNGLLSNLLEVQGVRHNCAPGGILHLERSSCSPYNFQAVSNKESDSK